MFRRKQTEEPDDKVYRERANYLTLFLALVVFVIGFGLLVFVHSSETLAHHLTISAVLREFGALLVASVPIPLLWELVLKRTLLDEVMSRARKSLAVLIGEARLADDVRVAGLRIFTNEFAYGINWQQYFAGVMKFDSFFAYGRSWVGTHAEQLGELARRRGARIRMVLPDPGNSELMAELARRFDATSTQVKQDIEDRVKEFEKIFVEPFDGKSSDSHADFSLYFTSRAPVFSFYRFDDIVVVALYKHRPGRGGKFPVVAGEKGGTLFSFVMDELHGFLDETFRIAKRVYPVPSSEGGNDDHS